MAPRLRLFRNKEGSQVRVFTHPIEKQNEQKIIRCQRIVSSVVFP
jgi:hypothetical protein